MAFLDSLGININKASSEQSDTEQGVVSTFLPELDFDDKTDEEIITLTRKWKQSWEDSEVKKELDTKSKDNENYWLGKQHNNLKGDENRPMVDNIIFESLETFLPLATRRNPEPQVTIKSDKVDVTAEETKYADQIEKKLLDIADEQTLKLTIRAIARSAELYFAGISQTGWDSDKNMPTEKWILTSKAILDPNGTVEPGGVYTGEYIGVYKKKSAGKLKKIAKKAGKDKAVAKIDELSKKEDGTSIQYIEWWTNEYTAWTLVDDEVIVKKRNPHWNYDKTEQQDKVDEYGEVTQEEVSMSTGINHLSRPTMPFHFLVEFNLGKAPVGSTSLTSQNLSNQDIINKRNRQIDKNVSSMNNGWLVSLANAGLTQEQLAPLIDALNNGGAGAIPKGAPRDAIDRVRADSIPSDVFNDTVDKRNRVRDIFGISGSVTAGTQNESTVRGKIINRESDGSRIGGSISEDIQQYTDGVLNYWLQMMYVYDEEYIQLEEAPKVLISVKEGSMLPKDNTTIANQAIDLASAGKMSTLDLYERLEYPNPEKMASNAWLEVNAPEVLYKNVPEVAEVMAARAQQAQDEKQAEMAAEVKKIQVEKTLDHRNNLEENTQKTRLDIIKKEAEQKDEEPKLET